MAESEGKGARAYREIERMIVFGEVRPGALISESEMMARTLLGRTPVREALQQLARDRMVEIHPNKGVLVPAVSVDDQLRQLELRRALELLAVRLACTRASKPQRDAIHQLVAELERGGYTMRTFVDAIKDTHGLIASAAHNAISPPRWLPYRRFPVGSGSCTCSTRTRRSNPVRGRS